MIQLGMVLERYTDQIIDYATNPVSGIQRVSKWPPSIAEVVTHCDGEVERLAKIARYKALGQAPRLPPPPRLPESNYEEMVAKHGRPIGRFEAGTRYEQFAGRRTEGRKQEFKRLTADDLRAIYATDDARHEPVTP